MRRTLQLQNLCNLLPRAIKNYECCKRLKTYHEKTLFIRLAILVLGIRLSLHPKILIVTIIQNIPMTATFSQPIPANEIGRIISLSEFDLDYTGLKENFEDLTKLAAKVAGTEISFVNLIDSFTQWTVANHGLPLEQMPREDSVCQYTILEDENFEITDLSQDDRFKSKEYVAGELNLRYYFGVPLKTNDGHNIGALCVMDTEVRILDPEKIELLKIIAGEIIKRMYTIRLIENLRHKAIDERETKLKVAHDIRGPLSGIVSLAKFISEQGDQNKLEDVLQLVGMIHKSGNSILELADDILNEEKKLINKPKDLKAGEFNLRKFKDKLEKLYQPQALNKKINFAVNANPIAEETPFYKNKLLQITGNLISNALKFTPENGCVSVDLDLEVKPEKNTLTIRVKDTGVGLSEASIAKILNGNESTTNGTSGERGYGFGLVLVKHLVDSLKGTMNIVSILGEGTTFDILLPGI